MPWRRKWQSAPVLAWRILWAEEPGRLQSAGPQRVGHDWATEHIYHNKTCYSRGYSSRCWYKRITNSTPSTSTLNLQPHRKQLPLEKKANKKLTGQLLHIRWMRQDSQWSRSERLGHNLVSNPKPSAATYIWEGTPNLELLFDATRTLNPT